MPEPTVQERSAFRRFGGTPRRDGHHFATRRATAVDRLVLNGIPRAMAEAWIQLWDESTAELHDFRAAPDFWAQGYRFAQEEFKRGYRPQIRLGTSSDEPDLGGL